MSSNWPLKKISDVAYFRNNKRIPLKSLDRAKRQGEFPYYGASGIVDYIDDYVFDGSYLLISEDGENLRTRKTPIAFQAHGKFWVNNHAHILEEKEEGILDYLEYYFSTLDLTPYITGAVQPKLNKANLDTIEIPIPPKDERRSINRTLNHLRDKIELNTQTNQILEQMAQAIFKSWFVDFDPVKAKIEALAAGGSADDAELAAMSVISAKTVDELNSLKASNPEAFNKLAQTAALFPAAMQDSELGEIPEGWSYCTFGDISACFDSKRVPLSKRKREEKQPGTIPYYGATSVMDYVNEWIFDDTYLLLGEDGSVVKDDGTPFVQYIWGKSWVNNHAHVLQGNNGVSTEHLMVFIKGTNIASYVTGAVQLKLNQKNMNSIPFLKASTEINLVFQGVLNGLYDAYKNNIESSQSLSSLRDSLLPRLLSGEMDLKDKE
ncbi:restriction endonuclease subunit S [Vibrio cholerae]|uniref:restriction endonuclease subunit S n=1 Tax=Vibrio cholerae TaxID=666 RepID=UPI000E6C73B1|nr:restriction endonuclease subunit S [Vibrio cholerae]